MLYLQFIPSTSIQERLRELDEARSELDAYARLPDEYTGELRRHALVESVHYSTQIEGNTLTQQQVRDLLSGSRVSAPPDQVQEVENYRDAMSYIQSRVVNRDLGISEDTIRTVHYLITKSLPGKYAPGQYRTEQNYVVDRTSTRRIFVPPDHENVPAHMAELAVWLNSRPDLPIPAKAALAHLNLVAIHPFLDGNGRTARVVESLVLYGGGFKDQDLVSLEAYFGRDNRGYYSALGSTLGPYYLPARDCTPWIEYSLQAHVEQAGSAVRLGREVKADIDGLWAALAPEELSQPQVMAVYLACRYGQVSNRVYRTIFARSAPSAVADFTQLIQRGLLERTGRGRSVVYVPSERTKQIYETIREGFGKADIP